jgi:phosphohistidine phosphatase
MSLFLVQHGKSLSKDQDPNQGLSEEGIITVKRIATVARKYGIQVSTIKHSGKTRAIQTAEILAVELNPTGGVQEMTGLNPMDDVVPLAKTLRSSDNLMLVGHLPFMEKLTSYLITDASEPLVLKFQNGGIVCLDQLQGNAAWFIKWTLMPKIE